MFGDRLQTDFRCSDCNECFESASNLLSHFALHVSEVIHKSKNFAGNKLYTTDITNTHVDKNNVELNEIDDELLSNMFRKKRVPDLYPIEKVKKKIHKLNKNITNATVDINLRLQNYVTETMKNFTKPKIVYNGNINNIHEQTWEDNHDESISLDIEEDFNPLRYCSISMDENEDETKTENNADKVKKKKYSCSFCSKLFGWSTDLKRHILTHTGERPFKCKLCSASFTRNFLLQKHECKVHHNKKDRKSVKKMRMPNLKPLFSKVNVNNMRNLSKSNKQKNKLKHFYTADNEVTNMYKDGLCGILSTHLNLVSTETTVQ